MIHVGEDYLKPRHVIGFLAAIGLTFGQTLVDLKTQTKNVDFSRALSVRPFPTGTGLPSVCNPGEMFFKSDASSGANLYGCVAPNSWVLESSGSAEVTGSSGAISKVADEGTPLTQRDTVNFIGNGISCVDNAGASRTDCTVTGGAGLTTLTTGSGDPSTSCTGPSPINFAKYYDSTANKMWTCVATNTWELDLTVNPAATFLITGTVGTAPGMPSSAKVYVYSDSTLKGLSAKDDTGQITRTVKPTDCSGTGFISKINTDGTVTCAAGGAASSPFGDWQKKTPPMTGDSTDKTIYSVTIPAGTLGSAGNTCIHGRIGFEHSTGSSNVDWKLTYGSTSVTLWSTPASGVFSHDFYLCNDPGTTNSQQLTFPPIGYNSAVGAEAYPNGGVAGVMMSTMAEDSTVDKLLKLTASTPNTDQLMGHYWIINK
jgi:hypothetical protein